MGLSEREEIFNERVNRDLELLKALETKLNLKDKHLKEKEKRLEKREEELDEREEFIKEAHDNLKEEQAKRRQYK